MVFHAAGAMHRERMLLAGNQLGKTLSAAFETAMHLTGKYPAWWVGKRFNEPVRWLAGSESAELTRKGIQRLLLGPPENANEWGTGAIPKSDIVDWSKRQGVPDAVSTIIVRHISGGISSVQLATYDQGRTKWQADTVHGVWFDEEPPEDIYFEGVTRTNTTTGPIYTTLTPLLGVSSVVKRFYIDKEPGTHLTMMEIDDAAHYTDEQRAAIIASYPAHERKVRTKGIPQLGSGRVFPIDEDDIKCMAFPIPAHWPQLGGIDFGWDHPSAGVRLAWDRDADCLYVIAAHRQREQTPAMFAASVKPWGEWLPWAWPHDGLQHDKGSGEQLAAQYRTQGLRMLPMRATFEDGSFGVEAGIADMLDRMQTGRLKIFSHLNDWFQEFNLYHRKDGLIVKKGDDLISATRYGMMMRRKAEVQNKPAPAIIRSPIGRSTEGWMG
jgi:phage terminase large subunit-like protein